MFIVSKDGMHYLGEGNNIGREVTAEEEAHISRVKIYIDKDDLSL